MKLEREAVLEVRFSGKGKAEVLGVGVEWLVFGSWDGMMTEVVELVAVTGALEHPGALDRGCSVVVYDSDLGDGKEKESEGSCLRWEGDGYLIA